MKFRVALKPFTIVILLPLFLSAIAGCDRNFVSVSQVQPPQEKPSPQQQFREFRLTLNQKTIRDGVASQAGEVNSDGSPNAVPLEPILKAIGATYTSDQDGTLRIKQGTYTASLSVNSEMATRNGYEINLLSQPSVRSGKMWVSSRVIPRLLEIDYVQWNPDHREYQLYRFQTQTDRETTLEQTAAEQVRRYLELLSQANQRSVSTQEWESLLSQEAMHNPKLFGNAASQTVPRLIEITSARQLTAGDTRLQGAVKVVVRYTTDYRPNPLLRTHWHTQSPEEVQYQRTFFLTAESGELRIHALITEQSNRSSLGAPIPFLEEADLTKLAQLWRQQNTLSYAELIGNFSVNLLSPLLAKAHLGDAAALEHFSEGVQRSQGWQDFLSLQGSKDPTFTFVEASSTKDHVAGTVVGNWIADSVNFTPVVMEVELKRKADRWAFTRIDNVRHYENSKDLWMNEAQLYNKVAKEYVYREVTRIGWILL